MLEQDCVDAVIPGPGCERQALVRRHVPGCHRQADLGRDRQALVHLRAQAAALGEPQAAVRDVHPIQHFTQVVADAAPLDVVGRTPGRHEHECCALPGRAFHGHGGEAAGDRIERDAREGDDLGHQLLQMVGAPNRRPHVRLEDDCRHARIPGKAELVGVVVPGPEVETDLGDTRGDARRWRL